MQKKFLIPIEIIPSHAHLSANAWAVLFGKKTEPVTLRPLSQRGQIVYRQTVKLIGPANEMASLRILGGVRKQTQIEITETEALALGIKPIWRLSGRLSRTTGGNLVGPAGKLSIKNGIIIPISHLHLSVKEAETLNLRQGQEVELTFIEDKEAHLRVVVRVHPSFRAVLHITPEVAGKFWFSPTEKAKL